MDFINLTSRSAKLGAKGAKTAWDITRTKSDITIYNQHPAMKLEYATRFIIGGGCINAPANEIGPNTSKTIQLEADATKLQFEGVLLYKLIPNESDIVMTNSIYLVLGWKVHATKGLYIYI
jgi:hypothetical protein